ncbi:hypothetical protein [Salinicoccus albus]|uniref:hypothetical protein n=1 Tax=Salinicoccus albus TaxID=418756 RepID=UPI0003775EF0|nr:hypothetical protein [Salinicoccus albus]
MKEIPWISSWLSLLSIVISICAFTIVMTRGPIIAGGPVIEIYISLLSLILAFIFSIIGLRGKTVNNIIPGISLTLTIAFGIFFLFVYVVSGMGAEGY